MNTSQSSSVRSEHLSTLNLHFVTIFNCPDNTNADTEVRSKWIELAAKHSVPIRCVWFTAAAEICEHNDAVRALNNTVSDPLVPQPIFHSQRNLMHENQNRMRKEACEVGTRY